MSEKKQKGKQTWCLNTVATLKPYVERKEHITRTTAARLIKPVTNWQRRELDTLRKQANQIIRGENVSALTYTVFGMTLEHPELAPVKKAFDDALQQHREPFTLPDNLKIQGMRRSEEAVFYGVGYTACIANPGEAWMIRRDYTREMDMLVIEEGGTYVVIQNAKAFTTEPLTGYRCIYPECVRVADIVVINSGQGQSLLKTEPTLDAPIPLILVKNIPTLLELPDTAQVGEMYGILNGNRFEVDVYMVWTPDGKWCEIMRNAQNEAELDEARKQGFLKQFGIIAEQHLSDDLIKKTAAARTTKLEAIPEQFGITMDEKIANHQPVDKPVKRSNPRYTLLVANERTTGRLNRMMGRRKRDGYLEELDGKHYVYRGDRWVREDSLVTMENDNTLHHGRVNMSSKPVTDVPLTCMPRDTAKQLPANELSSGVTYIDKQGHLIAWLNNEWADLGSLGQHSDYSRDHDGELRPKYNFELLKAHLGGMAVSDLGVSVDDWSKLPEHPVKGDCCTYYDSLMPSGIFSAVWDGEVWIETKPPFNPIAIPEYVVEDVTASESGDDTNWAFKEPKPNPNGFWARLGRVLGFK